jgi:Flp pilus assembly protein TadD
LITTGALAVAVANRPKANTAPQPTTQHHVVQDQTLEVVRSPDTTEAAENNTQELVQVARELERQNSARPHATTADQDHANAVQLWLNGLAQLRAGDSQGARALLERAAEQDSSIAGIHSALGRARANLGDWEGSRASYRRALELDANDIGALLGLATIEIFRDNDLDSAKKHAARALELNPQSEVAKNRLRAIEQLSKDSRRKR